jgi:ribonuclease P protein component
MKVPMDQGMELAEPVHICMSILKTRPEFLRAASARRQASQGFLVQARFRDDGNPLVQVGFTASKKIGNAVKRNRAKRRLRALARDVLLTMAKPGWDYVLVARPGVTVDRLYADLCTDLHGALVTLHRPR